MAFSLKQKEAKTLKFVISENGTAVDLSGVSPTPSIRFCIKQSKEDAIALVDKKTADFDKSQAASGILRVNLSSADLNLDAGKYVGELMLILSTVAIDKSVDITITIVEAVIK